MNTASVEGIKKKLNQNIQQPNKYVHSSNKVQKEFQFSNLSL